MKVALSNTSIHKGKNKSGFQFLPIIPLVKAVIDLPTGSYTTLKCRIIPTKSSSPLSEIQIPYFNTGTPEQLLEFLQKVDIVIRGQNIDSLR